MSFVIGAPCVDVMDKSCIEECPVDCIYEGERMLYIHPQECIDCGACEPVCPVEAIKPMQRLAEEWKPFQVASRDLFTRVGSPGGSTNVEPFEDPELVREFEKED